MLNLQTQTMKLFLDRVDHLMTLGLTNGSKRIDLAQLIAAAGHECLLKNFDEITVEDLEVIDYIVAQQQTNVQRYVQLSRKLRLNLDSGPDSGGLLDPGMYRQSEIQMTNKAFAHEKLQELGLNFLNTTLIRSKDDIINFEDEAVLIKPIASMQSRSDIDFAYMIMSKTELLSRIDESNIGTVTNGTFVIQEAVTNDRPIIWIGGYVNPQGEILIDGALKQRYLINDGYFEDRIRHPDRHLMYVEEVPLTELDEFYQESIRQIKIVLTHFRAKSTPFCIQAIVDDDNQVQLLDFNFGFGKGYALRIRIDTPEYIIDRIKYTYGGADTIPPNTTYLRNMIIDTPNGVTDEIKTYMDQNGIFIGSGLVEKDYSIDTPQGPYTFYYRNKTACPIIASSKQEADSIAENFLAFLSTLN